MLRKYHIEDARVLRDAFVANHCCFGKFDLSLEGQQRFLELKGKSCSIIGKRVIQNDGTKFSSRTIERSDKDLIKVVNEMGEAADGPEASLKVIKDCILHPGSCCIIRSDYGYEDVDETCRLCQVPKIGEHERTAELHKLTCRPRPRHNSI